MKVWEKCNEVKGTNATINEIARWAYANRICPLDFDVALEIDLPLDDEGFPKWNGFLNAAEEMCLVFTCGMGCLMAFLQCDYMEVQDGQK